jgi:sugar lactone lactonase YvrE
VGENVTKYEVAHNPARDNLDSDPYGIAWSPLGLAVTDAAGNSLLLLHPDGRLSCLMTFKAETFNGHAAQRVPTTVVWHDGAFYVGELGGGGTPNGQSHVWKVVPGQGKTMAATGFTTISGLAFGPDGSMYVSELAKNGLAAAEKNNDLGGAIVRVWPDGRRTTIAPKELIAPAGIAVAGDNTIYVATGSVFAGGGKLLSIAQ